MRRKAVPRFRLSARVLLALLLILLGSFILFIMLYSRIWGWDGQSRFTVVLYQVTKEADRSRVPIVIFSLEPKTKRAVYITIPPNTLLSVPYGYQDYVASSVYGLGQLDPKRGGGRLLAKSIQQTFGILVNGFYSVSSDEESLFPATDAQLKEFKKYRLSLISMLLKTPAVIRSIADRDTSLSIPESYKLWREVRAIRFDQIKFYDLNNTEVLHDSKQPDGSIVTVVDTGQFDFLFSDSFTDSIVRIEPTTVAVVNATDHTGLASSFSRVLEHMGVHVISNSSSSSSQKKTCQIFLSELSKNSMLVVLLKQHFGCEVANEEKRDEGADIQILLGEDFLTL